QKVASSQSANIVSTDIRARRYRRKRREPSFCYSSVHSSPDLGKLIGLTRQIYVKRLEVRAFLALREKRRLFIADTSQPQPWATN
ncbi:MAG: hypothetical protein ACREUM_01545, partial [Nitrosospira sp.]